VSRVAADPLSAASRQALDEGGSKHTAQPVHNCMQQDKATAPIAICLYLPIAGYVY